MPIRILIILFSFTTCVCSYGQFFEEKDFKHFTSIDGLTNNNISGIEQDSIGYIWISTGHGLNRFDGVSFKQFLHNSEPNSIPDNAVFSIHMLRNNQLGVATDNGAQVIDTRTLVKKNLNIPTEEALQYWGNACRYVCNDNAGNFEVSTKTGFYIFSKNGELKKRYDRYTTKDIGQAWMMFGNHLYELPNGNVMQQNNSGLLIYDYKKNNITDALHYYPAIKSLISSVRQRDIFFFVSDYVLVLINTGNNSLDLIDIRDGKTNSFPANINLTKEVGWQTKLFRLNNNTWALNCKSKGFYLLEIDVSSRKLSFLSKKYFNNYLCTNIFLDRYKRLWIGTDEGLFMQNSTRAIIETFTAETKKTNNNFSITSLYVIGDRLFAGTDNNQILVIDKQTHKILHKIVPGNKSMINVIVSFARVSRDTIWAATTEGLYLFDTKRFLCQKLALGIFNNRMPQWIYLDRKGKVWLSGFTINSVYTYDPTLRKVDSFTKSRYPVLNVNLVTSLATDADGNTWIGGDAIARWNPHINKIDSVIERVSTQKNRKKGYTVMSDSKNNIWTSISDDGFAKLTGSNRVHIRPENLATDFKGAISPCIFDDKIFTTTSNGVAFLNTKNFKSIVFTTADGVPGQPITSSQFSYDSSDRSVWFACKNTICKIPFSGSNDYSSAPNLIVSELSVFNDTIINHPVSNITLKHFQNDIKVSLTAINFSDPGNMRFAYRFKNDQNGSWIEMGMQQNILLTNISPGTYRLELKVYAYDNKWPQQTKEILIRVQAPFWRTLWFVSLIAFLVAAAIYFLYRRRIKRIHQKANLDKLLAQTEMKALHSQMNPHFIFNCLNSIREMILNNENKQASRYLSKFAHLIRMTLDNSTKPFISLKNSIDYLQRYLEMEKIRTDHFTYYFEIDKDLVPEEIFLPPMLIQPFVENAIWHGQQLGRPMHLSIRFLKSKNELICIVEDDGIGIETSLKNKQEWDHQSVAIANIRQRIQLLNEKHNLRSTVLVEDKSVSLPKNGTGTKVTLHLPVKNTEL